jgi:trimethylamine--corrinoid protein Co-methyltransferase
MRVTLEALSAGEIQNVHQATLDVLSRKGLSVMSAPALETFRRHGFAVDGQRVLFGQAQIDKALESAPGSFGLASRNPERRLAIGPGERPALLSASGVPKIITEDGGQRPVSFDDYLDMLRLTQTSPVLNMSNSGALYPAHENPGLALYLQVFHTLAMTDMPLVGQTEGEALSRYSVDMAQAASGVLDAPVTVGICNSLSPLAWDARMLEGIRVYAERGQAVNISCCSMSGATAPVYVTGAIVQANCEVLGGLVYSQLVKPGTPVIYGTTSSVMDMATMGLALGAPEYGLISVGCSQMAAFYRLPFRGGGGLTDAKDLDFQAGMESATNLFLSFFEGVHFMLQSVGILESFMSVAFDKWVLDEEILGRLQRIREGLGPWPADLPETLAQGLEAGGYLKLKSTLRNFRKEFYRPALGDRRNFEAFRQRGRSLRDDAWDLVRSRLSAYRRPAIEPSALEAMGRIFGQATGQAPPEATDGR